MYMCSCGVYLRMIAAGEKDERNTVLINYSPCLLTGNNPVSQPHARTISKQIQGGTTDMTCQELSSQG